MAYNRKRTNASTKKLKLCGKRIQIALGKIHLVDKCLLVIMVMLLSQSAYILLTNGAESSGVNHIDIVIRTAAASIFGYLISANFLQRSLASKLEINESKPIMDLVEERAIQGDTPQNRIGFVPVNPDSKLKQGSVNVTPAPPINEKVPTVARMQIIVATAIAIFCLISLILVRNLSGNDNTINPSSSAILAQFRDFISGCVGFLIGCPTQRSREK